MDQYDMMMIVPDEQKFDFETYERWKQANPINIDLKKRFYVLAYSE